MEGKRADSGSSNISSGVALLEVETPPLATEEGKRRFLLILLGSLGITILSIIFFTAGVHLGYARNTHFSMVEFPGVDGHPIPATLALPSNRLPDERLPGVIVFHGFLASSQWMLHYLQALASAGIAGIAIDQPGHAANPKSLRAAGNPLEEDGLSTYDYLASLPEIDASRIAGLGFSMGGGTVQRVGWQTEPPRPLLATVLLASTLQNSSSPLPYNFSFPANLLVAIGRLDELASFAEQMELLRGITNTSESPLQEDVVYGSFADGSARKVCLGGSDHVFAALDQALIDCSVDWFVQALGPTLERRAPPKAFGIEFVSMLAGLSFYCLVLLVMAFTSPSVHYGFCTFNLKGADTREREAPAVRRKATSFFSLRLWWLPHMALIYVPFFFSLLLQGVPFPVSFFLPIFCWFILYGLAFFAYVIFLSRGMGYLDSWKSLSTLKEVWKGALCTVLLFSLYVFLLQLILYRVPWSFNLAVPYLKALKVAGIGAGFNRYALMIGIWIPASFASYFEIEAISMRIDERFSLWNFASLNAARTLTPIVVFIIVLIATASSGARSFGDLSFVVLFLYPTIGNMFLTSLAIQFGRFVGHSSLTIAIVVGGMLSYLVASLLTL